MVSDGLIDFGHLERAFQGLTSEGGKFAGGMDRASKGIHGLWSTLEDEWNTGLTRLGEKIVTTFDIKGALAGGTEALGVLTTESLRQLQSMAAGWKGVGDASGDAGLAMVNMMEKVAQAGALVVDKLTGFEELTLRIAAGAGFDPAKRQLASLRNQDSAAFAVETAFTRMRNDLEDSRFDKIFGESFAIPEGSSFEASDRSGHSAAAAAAKAAAGPARMIGSFDVAAFSRQIEDAGRIFDATRTPMELFNTEMDRLGGFLAAGALDADTYARAVKAAEDEVLSKVDRAGAGSLPTAIERRFDFSLPRRESSRDPVEVARQQLKTQREQLAEQKKTNHMASYAIVWDEI